MATQEVAQSVPDIPPPRDWDGRLPYYVHQLQRSESYKGYLDEVGMTLDEMRALFEEMTSYFGVCDPWSFPLPCTGLPGHLHRKYDRDDEVGQVLLLGIEYVGAVIRNERKTMHNRWLEAQHLIRKIEERGHERLHIMQSEAAMEADRAKDAIPQRVYFIASESGPVKIGIAGNPESRLRGLQTGHHERLTLLAICEGGEQQERAYHKRFAKHRLTGEWFERSPEIEAEITRLSNTILKELDDD